MANETEPNLQYRIFQSLLFLASDEGREPLPSLEDALVVEIIAGTIDFLNGEGYAVPGFSETRFSDDWQRRTNSLMDAALIEYGAELNANLGAVLRDLTRFTANHSHGENWWESPIRHCLEFTSCRISMRSTFHLSVPFVAKAKESFQNFPSDIAEQCKNIAERMKKYVRRDVTFIQLHFHW